MADLTVPALLLLTTLGASAALIQTRRELAEQQRKLRRYSSLSSAEEFQRQVQLTTKQAEQEISNLQGQKRTLASEIDRLQQQRRKQSAELFIESLESYEIYYDFTSQEEYLFRLEDNKRDQKTMQQQGRAYLAEAELVMENSKGKGKRFTKNLLDLIKLTFENECKSALGEAKYNNLSKLEARIRNAFDRINKLSAITYCKISSQYLDLKIQELRLKCEFEQKKQRDKEEQQEIKKRQRERARELRESEEARKQIEEVEKRKRLHEEELAQIRQEERQAQGKVQRELQLRIRQLEEQVEKDRSEVEEANSRYRRVKEGHIFVVSNIGSLGQDIYRIFMTKSENEDDYIRTMNYSVPFPFEVRYKIYAEEASDTIDYLHQRFQDRRVNLDNERRHFFRVAFDEIEQVITEMCQEKEGIKIREVHPQPENSELSRSRARERKNQPSPSGDEL